MKTKLFSVFFSIICYANCHAAFTDCAQPKVGVWANTTETFLSVENLKNGMYQGIEPEVIPLTDGKYEGEPYTKGGAMHNVVIFYKYAFGDLNGDEVDDAVVLLINDPGGSGTFRHLAVVINQYGVLVNADTIFVGDRTQVKKLFIKDNQIIFEAVEVGPDDPYCCGTQKVRKTYVFQKGKLIESSITYLGSTIHDAILQFIFHPILVLSLETIRFFQKKFLF